MTGATEPEHLDELRNAARLARERFELYRAKAYSLRPTTAAQLRELERGAELAASRLAHARSRRV